MPISLVRCEENRMLRLRTLAIGFVLFPFIEFATFSWVSSEIGFLRALVLMIATSLLGMFLLKRSWLVLLNAARQNRHIILQGAAARDGLLFALGALLLAIPGFASDILGLLCLLPSLKYGAGRAVTAPRGPVYPPSSARQATLDLDRSEWTEKPDDRAERR